MQLIYIAIEDAEGLNSMKEELVDYLNSRVAVAYSSTFSDMVLKPEMESILERVLLMITIGKVLSLKKELVPGIFHTSIEKLVVLMDAKKKLRKPIERILNLMLQDPTYRENIMVDQKKKVAKNDKIDWKFIENAHK